jgi:hypothetical protein
MSAMKVKGKGKGKGDKGGKDGKAMKTMKAPMKTRKAMKPKWPRGETMRIFVKPKPLGCRAPLLVKADCLSCYSPEPPPVKGKGKGKGKRKGKGDKGGKDCKAMKTMKAPMKTMKAMKQTWPRRATKETMKAMKPTCMSWPRGETYRIFVKPMPKGSRVPLLVTGHDTIYFIKGLVSFVPGWDIEVREQRLKFAGQQLEDGHTLSYYNIANGSILFLYEVDVGLNDAK